MGKIILLDELTASQIAAGEVIERPASVVKEMAENAVDAGATVVSVEIKAGGIKYIKISDNGCGFDEDDAVIAFDKHATSKIMNAEDLFGVTTLGFRGEALASIAAVSDVTLISRNETAESGFMVNVKGGKIVDFSAHASSKGSTFIVRDLFFNTPARYKFLKKDTTEAGYVADTMQKLALAHPDVSFKLTCDGKLVFHSPGNNDMLSCIHSIYGKSVTDNICFIKHEQDGIKVTGYTGVREATYGNRSRQHLFVNGRYIRSKVISSALDEAYKTVTMKGKFPFAVLTVTVNPMTLDVNVHPTKTEVRFSDEQAVFRAVYHAVYNGLFGELEIRKTDKNTQVSELQRDIGIMRQDAVRQTSPWKRKDDNDTVSKKEIGNLIDFISKAPVPNEDIHISGSSDSGFAVKESAVYDFDKPIIKTEVAEEIKIDVGSEKTTLKGYIQPEIEVKVAEPEVKCDLGAQDEGGALNKKYNDTSIYTESRVIGQLFDTYILMEYRDKLVLLDQHAAHERIMYENIKEALENSEIQSQMLLLPITFTMSPSESRQLKENMEFFDKLGFEIEEFGINTFVVRSIPMILEGSDIEGFIVDGIAKAIQGGKAGLYDDRTIFTMACKAAVKANMRLSKEEIDALLKTLAEIENHGTCPHGRPVTVTMSKYEIERKFHRT